MLKFLKACVVNLAGVVVLLGMVVAVISGVMYYADWFRWLGIF